MEIDLLTNQNWSNLPGTKITEKGLQVSPLNLQISHNDGSEPQPNPPANVRGPHLQVHGGFAVESIISRVDQQASLLLYGQVPIVYDTWRQERGSVRIDIMSNVVVMKVWDGSSSTSIDERTEKISLKDENNVSISHKNGQLALMIDGTTIASMPDHGVFRSGNIWFGLDAKPGTNGWKLDSLRAKAVGKSAINVAVTPSYRSAPQADSLKSLSSANTRKVPIGTAVSSYPFFTDDRYRKLILGHFSMMTIENDMKFQFLQPVKGIYSYENADSLVEVATANDIKVHGHMLIAHKSNPQWVEESRKEDRKQIMVDHITNVMSHYRGKLSQWDVINEPMSDDETDYANQNLGLRQQVWFDAIGEDYIDIAFRSARAADPSAKLFINEYGIGKDGQRWEGLLALVKRMQARGVPIDGVGFESHVYHAKDSIDPQVLKNHIQILASLGLQSRISENDVLGDDPDVQASQYSSILRVCLEEPSCTSYGIWGVSDLYGSTITSDRYPPVLGDSLVWDEDFKPKPALSALQATLRNF